MTDGQNESAATETRNWLKELGLGEYVAVDVETTGLSSDEDSVIELAAVRFKDGHEVDAFSSFVSFAGKIPPFITQLTGITDQDLIGAPGFGEVARDFLRFVGETPLVGQNVDFDIGFVRAGIERTRSAPIERTVFSARGQAVDTSMLARAFWPELTGFSLSALTRRFDVPLPRSHRAADDARATGELLAKLVDELPSRVWQDLSETLFSLIGTTVQRSRFFFAALTGLSRGMPKPEVAQENFGESDSERSIVTPTEEQLLGPDGLFEQRFPQFKSRHEQLEMTLAIRDALAAESICVVEAPTGVGKSLAYLVPALKWSKENAEESRQVVVSSHTKTLQEQLRRKDAGELRAVVGDGFNTAVLKGRNNYLCKRRLNTLIRESADRLTELDRVQLMPLVRWSELTTTGDINEIGGFRPRRAPHLWAQIASDASTCSGSNCSAAKGDYHKIASDRANHSQIVFVNHSLLMSDPARFMTTPGKRKALVIDEAHQLEGAVVAALTVELSPAAFRAILMRLLDERGNRGVLPRLLAHAPKGSNEFSSILDRVRALYASTKQGFQLLGDQILAGLGDNKRSKKARFSTTDPIGQDVTHFLTAVEEEWQELVRELTRMLLLAAEWSGENKPSPELLLEVRSVADRATEIGSNLSEVISVDREEYVKWVECGHGRSGIWCSVFNAPVDVSSHLRQNIWSHSGGTVLTSATLSIGSDVGYFRRTVGLDHLEDRVVSDIAISSPFRLAEQMRIFVTSFVPEPRDPVAHGVAVTRLVTKIVEKFHRGTLVLCTSNESVEEIARSLGPIMRAQSRVLLSQGGGASPAELVPEFREARAGVMIGAASFWEGIDVIGDALELLIVTKLPFDVPTDPWIAARCESIQKSGGEPFNEYTVPVATLRLRQGLGRLIRHPHDRGIAVITDPRLFTARYGRRIRSSISPDMRSVAGDLELVGVMHDFFESTAS